jgi:hypothetical protein
MDIRGFALAGIVAVASHACASNHPPAEEAEVPPNVLALEVENRNWSDVEIYIIHDGTRERFTQVNAAKSVTVAIPPRLVSANGTIQLQVHRIGGHDDTFAPIGGPQFATPRDDYVSPVVSVRTGYTVELTLEDDLNRSTVGVW